MSYNIEQINGGNLSLASAGLAAGTTTGTFKTQNTLAYIINAIFKSKSATDNLAFSAGHAAVTAGKAALFAVWIDAAGAVTTTQSVIVDAADNVPVPATVSNKALVGLIKVVTDGSTTFTPGTTGLAASGVTATYLNCACMPGSSQ